MAKERNRRADRAPASDQEAPRTENGRNSTDIDAEEIKNENPKLTEIEITGQIDVDAENAGNGLEYYSNFVEDAQNNPKPKNLVEKSKEGVESWITYIEEALKKYDENPAYTISNEDEDMCKNLIVEFEKVKKSLENLLKFSPDIDIRGAVDFLESDGVTTQKRLKELVKNRRINAYPDDEGNLFFFKKDLQDYSIQVSGVFGEISDLEGIGDLIKVILDELNKLKKKEINKDLFIRSPKRAAESELKPVNASPEEIIHAINMGLLIEYSSGGKPHVEKEEIELVAEKLKSAGWKFGQFLLELVSANDICNENDDVSLEDVKYLERTGKLKAHIKRGEKLVFLRSEYEEFRKKYCDEAEISLKEYVANQYRYDNTHPNKGWHDVDYVCSIFGIDDEQEQEKLSKSGVLRYTTSERGENKRMKDENVSELREYMFKANAPSHFSAVLWTLAASIIILAVGGLATYELYLKEKISEYRGIAGLKTTITDQENRIANLEKSKVTPKDLEKVARERDGYKAGTERLKGTIRSRDGEIDALKKKVSEMGATIATLKADSSDAEKEAVEEVEKTLAERNRKIASLNKKLSERLDTIEVQKKRLKKLDKKLTAKSDALFVMEEKAKEKDNLLTERNAKIISLEEAVSKNEKASQENITGLKKKLEEEDEKVKNLEKTLNLVKKDNRDLKDRVAVMKKELEGKSSKEPSHDIAKLKNEVSGLKGTVAKLDRQLAEKEAAITDLENSNKTLKAENERLTGKPSPDITALKDEISDLKEKVTNLEGDKKTLKAENERLMNKYSRDLAQRNTDLDSSKKDIKSLKAKILELRKKIEKAEKEKVTLAARISELNNKLEKKGEETPIPEEKEPDKEDKVAQKKKEKKKRKRYKYRESSRSEVVDDYADVFGIMAD